MFKGVFLRLLEVQVKNRESAARSRARKQEYTAQLEVQVAKLREENRLLLEKVCYMILVQLLLLLC